MEWRVRQSEKMGQAKNSKMFMICMSMYVIIQQNWQVRDNKQQKMSVFQQQTSQYVEQIKSGTNSILVSIRIRPLNSKERKISNFQTIKVLDGKLLSLSQPDTNTVDVLRKNRSKDIQYAFDFVYNHHIQTRAIYEETVSILLPALLQGYNASVLAYGATSCGKTYTMVGDSDNNPGIMAMAVLELLNMANQMKKYQDIVLKASYIEIYNENIKDLLISQDRNLDIRQDPKQGVSIAGVTQVLIDNLSQLKTVLKVGNRNRTMESTGCNQVSSRSHGIFQIGIQIKNKAQSTVQETISSKLFLIDLAGSERASNTTNKGQRMVEGAKINQSLLVLGNCIQALSDASQKGLKNAFVPYRGSKLTRLLKDSLGGNCRTVMIAHVSPAANLFEQTYNTLLYAHRAKNIKNNPIRNTLVAQTHLSNYVNVINNLKRENEQLKNEMRQKQLNSLKKQKNKYSGNLPVLENAAYNEEISKFESQILKQFVQQQLLTQKITNLQIKIEEIAFIIYQKEVFKADERSIKKKNDEAAQLSKQKMKLQKKLQQKIEQRNKIVRQIEKNSIIGSTGQTYLKSSIKEKKVEIALKTLKLKEQIIREEKKQINNFMKKIKNTLKNNENTASKQKPKEKQKEKEKEKEKEKQKVLLKKNNIISRITYSQIHLNDKDESNTIKSQQQISSPKQSPTSYKKTKVPQTKRSTQKLMKNENSFSLSIQTKNAKFEQMKKDRKSAKKTNKVVGDIEIQNLDSEANKKEKERDKEKSLSPRERLKGKKSAYWNNKSSKALIKSKSTKIDPKFDFIYIPH